jgi:hypothetical protein
MYCQSCGAHGPTHRVFFVQHIGAVVLYFHKRISGDLCRGCVNKYFTEYFFVTLFLGWWGVVSFFATPVVLLIDLANYIPAVAALRPLRAQSRSTPELRSAAAPVSPPERVTGSAPALPVCPAARCQKPLRLPPDAHGMLKCRSCGHTFLWRNPARVARQAALFFLTVAILGALVLWTRRLVAP